MSGGHRSLNVRCTFSTVIVKKTVMPHGPALSNFEQGQIIAYRDSGMSFREISRKINRSVDVIHRYSVNPIQYASKKRRGITKKLSNYAKRRLIRATSNSAASASNMKRTLELNVSVRRVQQIIHDTPHLNYRKMSTVPWMNQSHFQERMNWAINHVAWRCEWDNVIFSDEKKFNLDGPDGLMYYWRDSRKGPLQCRRRAFKGGSVMVWGGISVHGKTQLVILEGKQTADSYIRTLRDFLLPLIRENMPDPVTFQHDNATIHTAYITRMWLLMNNIKTMYWPTHSPDLNPIENVWGLLSRRIYSEGRVFHTTGELKSSIIEEWEKFETSMIETLFKSMPDRCLHVIKKNGRCV